MKERLLVYLRGSRIGFIEFDHDANSREFSYDADYLASSGACPISLLLPLQEKPFNSWEMSDEGYPSPIYARIGEVIRGQVERVNT